MRTHGNRFLFGLGAGMCLCLVSHAQAANDTSAVSCPKKPGKILVDIAVRVLPEGRAIQGEGDDAGASYDLTSPPLKAGDHVELECMYGPPGSKPGTIPGRKFTPENRASVAVPSSATYCQFTHRPNSVTCAKAAANQ